MRWKIEERLEILVGLIAFKVWEMIISKEMSVSSFLIGTSSRDVGLERDGGFILYRLGRRLLSVNREFKEFLSFIITISYRDHVFHLRNKFLGNNAFEALVLSLS